MKNNSRLLRQNERLTLKELADEVNISKSTLSRYEIGDQEFQGADIPVLCSFFNVSSDYLLGFVNEHHKPIFTPDEEKKLFALFGEEIKKLTPDQIEEIKNYAELVKIRDELKKGDK